MHITLNEEGSYYEYCKDNNINFLTDLVLYGYENK